MPKGVAGVTYVEVACLVCGVTYNVAKGREKYKRTCSHACRVRAGAITRSTGVTEVVRQCPICRAEFSVKKGQEKNKQYCSIACGHKARAQKISTAAQRQCAVCGSDFVARRSSKKKTCSVECGRISRRKYGAAVNPKHPEVVAAIAAESRARKRNAVPAWYDAEKVRRLYRLAAQLTTTCGVEYHVDHIVPLVSKAVSGLHWHGNMQVIERKTNQSKGNRVWPDMP